MGEEQQKEFEIKTPKGKTLISEFNNEYQLIVSKHSEEEKVKLELKHTHPLTNDSVHNYIHLEGLNGDVKNISRSGSIQIKVNCANEVEVTTYDNSEKQTYVRVTAKDSNLVLHKTIRQNSMWSWDGKGKLTVGIYAEDDKYLELMTLEERKPSLLSHIKNTNYCNKVKNIKTFSL